jgi:hypothetical protein
VTRFADWIASNRWLASTYVRLVVSLDIGKVYSDHLLGSGIGITCICVPTVPVPTPAREITLNQSVSEERNNELTDIAARRVDDRHIL